MPEMTTQRTLVFNALDAECAAPRSLGSYGINFDCLCQMVDRHIRDPEDDDELEDRWDSISAWARERNVKVRV